MSDITFFSWKFNDTCDILAVADENKDFLFLLHNRKNRYTRGEHAIAVAGNARIYSTIRDLIFVEASVSEETGRFPHFFVKIKNALA